MILSKHATVIIEIDCRTSDELLVKLSWLEKRLRMELNKKDPPQIEAIGAGDVRIRIQK